MSFDTGPLGHQRVRAAGVVAAGVAVILVAQGVIRVIAASLLSLSMGSFPAEFLASFLMVIDTISVVAFAIGVGLSLWLLAPITRRLTVGSTVWRGVIAAAVGAGVVMVVHLFFEWIEPEHGLGALFAGTFRADFWGEVAGAAARAFHEGASLFAGWAPVVVLLVLLVWLRLTRQSSPGAVAADNAEV